MPKLSKAEKERRKEQKIFAQFDRILECLEAAYRNQNSFAVGEQLTWEIAFTRGVYCAAGIGMYRKLQKRYDDWYDSHIELIHLYDEKIEHAKKNGAYEASLTRMIREREEERADGH